MIEGAYRGCSDCCCIKDPLNFTLREERKKERRNERKKREWKGKGKIRGYVQEEGNVKCVAMFYLNRNMCYEASCTKRRQGKDS